MPRMQIVLSFDDARPRQIFELCNHHVGLNKEAKRLRLQYKIDEIEMRRTDNASRLKFLKTFTNGDLQNDVRKVLKKLKIPDGNFWYIYQYVIDGQVGNMGAIKEDPEGLIIDYNPKDKNDILFKIGPKTTKSDLDEAWATVVKWRYAGKAPRRKRKLQQKRDYEVFILYKSGMSLPELCLYIDDMHGKTSEDGMTEELVRKIIKNFNKKLGLDSTQLK